MYCPKCKSEISSGSNFCPNCGNQIIIEPVSGTISADGNDPSIDAVPIALIEDTNEPNSEDAPTKRNVVGVIIRWIFCVLLIVFGVCSMRFFPIAALICALAGVLISPFLDSVIPKFPMWARIVLTCALVFFSPIISVFVDPPYIAEPTEQVATPIPSPSPTVYDGMIIVDSSGFTSSQYGTRYLEGSVKNVSGKDITYAQITFSLYDSEGNRIGTAFDNISNFEAGTTWKYKALVLDETAYSAKLAKLIGR